MLQQNFIHDIIEWKLRQIQKIINIVSVFNADGKS